GFFVPLDRSLPTPAQAGRRLGAGLFTVDDLAADENDQAVASAVISLGQNLNLRVIAEGVETDDQVAFLRRNNCDEMQGYHFSRPVCAQDVEELLGGGRKD
ncbi:EAL domain-containing protein, partial [Mesorhizobium sp. M0601]|uniref:EAL domain-containing protein n=1 Tax=Mesorhizobium sp. M0601 TaxID=2956969 RepID=UPI0033389561